jgi:uncharacterized protein (DUF433 family)
MGCAMHRTCSNGLVFRSVVLSYRPGVNIMDLPAPLITSDIKRLGGTPVFAGTRVPVKTLFDHLEAGDTLDVFLAHFPDVSRDQAVAVLNLAARQILTGALVTDAA